MYVYSPERILPARIKEAERILGKVRAKHAFITGSFLYRRAYKDIDLFVVTRSKRDFSMEGVDVHVIHPNRLSSLFYHSASKLCVSKSILPRPKVRTTMSDYFDLLNSRLTPVDNIMDRDKEFRDAVLATIYHAEARILDSEELKSYRFHTHESFESFILAKAPAAFRDNMRPAYRRRFFAGFKAYYADAQPSIPSLIDAI